MLIEKSVPMPNVSTSGRGRPSKYPFATMEVGDSVLVEGKSTLPSQCSGYNAAQQYGMRAGKKFSGRKEGDDKVRIWRTS